MGQIVHVIKFDDFDKTESEEVSAYRFTGPDGRPRVIDLLPENRQRMVDEIAKAWEPWLQASRPDDRAPAPSPRSKPAKSQSPQRSHTAEEIAEFSSWCDEHDLARNPRGKSHQVLWDAFEAKDVSLVPERFKK